MGFLSKTAICGALFLTLSNVAASDVVVVVADDSPLESLSRARLADIYLGRVHRMPNGTPVVPLDQQEVSAAHAKFYEKYLGKTPAQVKGHWSKLIFTGRGQPPRAVPDAETMAAIVADNPNAIGYVDSASVDRGLRVLPIE